MLSDLIQEPGHSIAVSELNDNLRFWAGLHLRQCQSHVFDPFVADGHRQYRFGNRQLCPYVEQLVGFRADDPARKIGGLILEVKLRTKIAEGERELIDEPANRAAPRPLSSGDAFAGWRMYLMFTFPIAPLNLNGALAR